MSSFCTSYSHFFSKKNQHICVSLDVNINELLTNNIVSFEQLGQNHHLSKFLVFIFCNISGSGDEGSDQEREWEEQQILKGVSGIQQVIIIVSTFISYLSCRANRV